MYTILHRCLGSSLHVLQGFLGSKEPLNCPCNFFVIASLRQINKTNVGRFPVQNLRGKKHFHSWKRLAIPAVIIGCSFENKAHISETPKYFFKREVTGLLWRGRKYICSSTDVTPLGRGTRSWCFGSEKVSLWMAAD